jgi:hypothetical protein
MTLNISKLGKLTLSIITISIMILITMTHCIIKLGIFNIKHLALGIAKPSVTTFSIMVLNIITLSHNDTQYYYTQQFNLA